MIVKGFNKAVFEQKISWILKNQEVKNRPCVFLSHKREDKAACRIIAKYFKDAGIDYYLDEEDDALQQAASLKDPIKITESIKAGIRESSHMLVIVSERTYQSLWVPFEVGYGHASIIDQNDIRSLDERIKLSVLTLRDIAEKSLPDYLQVGYVIRGTKSLNQYISKIAGKQEESLVKESRIYSYNKSSHPLDNVLNWQL
jgi:hypothetical protein